MPHVLTRFDYLQALWRFQDLVRNSSCIYFDFPLVSMNKDSKKKKGKINIKFVTFENNGTYDIYCLNSLVLIIGEYSPKFSLPGFVTENEFCPQKMQKNVNIPQNTL